MPAPALPALSPALFARVFPFHLVVDSRLCLLGLGNVLARVCPWVVPPMPLSQAFLVERPAGPVSFDDLARRADTICLLRAVERPALLLRGQWVRDERHNHLLFLGSPWLHSLTELSALGLSLRDYPPHEAAMDYLLAIQTTQASLQDACALADNLSQEKATVARCNHILERFTRRLSEEAAERQRAEQALREAQTALQSVNGKLAILIQRRTAQLARSEELYQTLVELVPDAVWVQDDDGFQFVNPAAVRLFGATGPEELLREPVCDYLPLAVQVLIQRCFDTLAADAGAGSVPFLPQELNRLDGSRVATEIACCRLDYDGRPAVLVVARDVSERRRQEAKLEFRATHDRLTELPNRYLFVDRLQQLIPRAQRQLASFAVLVVDLDRFKLVNDSLGHQQGDELLRAMAVRLRHGLREGDTVARLGGDEFVLMLPGGGDRAAVTDIVERLRAALADPLLLGDQELRLSASIGICFCPQDGDDVDSLLKHADLAMYRAKANGGNRYCFYTADLQQALDERLALERQLRSGLAANELVLHYQPQVDLASGRLVGLEALVRWQHPEWGLIGPGRFIPVAEECGLIIPLGAWVLREACRQVRAWQQAGLAVVPVAVNVSARQFLQPDLFATVQAVLQQTELAPALLALELTESLTMQDPEHSLSVLSAFKGLGVQLAIDDFGTGYSNLGYLRSLPVDKLKIDQAFVRELAQRPADRAIVQAIVDLARALQLRVLAEGVETDTQLAVLRDCGCDEVQGYWYSRPLPAAAIAAWLTTRPVVPAGGA